MVCPAEARNFNAMMSIDLSKIKLSKGEYLYDTILVINQG
jgi:hypothetical protein